MTPYEGIRRELERLREAAPQGITLFLEDGSTYVTKPMTALQFCAGVFEALENQDAPLHEPLSKCAGASPNVGHLWTLFHALGGGEEAE